MSDYSMELDRINRCCKQMGIIHTLLTALATALLALAAWHVRQMHAVARAVDRICL